jgi:hypothetical protein
VASHSAGRDVPANLISEPSTGTNLDMVLANRAGDGITPLATPHLGEALSAQDPHARLGLATDEREVGPRGRANTGAAEAAASPTVVQNGRKLIPRN